MLGFRKQLREREVFYRTLSVSLSSGIHVDNALKRSVAALSSGPRVAGWQVAKDVTGWSRHLGALAEETESLNAAGDAGRLDEALLRLANGLERRRDREWGLLKRCLYPLLVLHLVPMAFFSSDLVTAPSSFLAKVGLAWSLGWVSLAGLGWCASRIERNGAFWSRVPGLHGLMRGAARIRFLRALSWQYSSGVPIDRAIHTARQVVAGSPADDDFQPLEAAVSAGRELSEGLRSVRGADRHLLEELAVAADAGALEEALERVCTVLEAEHTRALDRAAKVISGAVYGLAVIVVLATVLKFWTGYLDQLNSLM